MMKNKKTFGQFLSTDFARLIPLAVASAMLIAIIALYTFYLPFDFGLPICGGIALIAVILLIREAYDQYKKENA